MVFAGRQTAFVLPALMSATLKQIADRTGVSPMTISRVLRGVGRVRVETRRRVLEVAEEMGHFRLKGVVFPPPIRQGHTDHNLKLLLPYSHSDLVMTELVQQFLTGLKQRLHETGGLLYTALFRSLEDIFEEARRHRIHGIILRQILPADYVEKLQAHYPIVYAAADDFYGGVDRVSINENCCAARILNYLTFKGHKDIAFFGIADSNARFRSDENSWSEIALVDRPVDAIHGARYAAWTYLAQDQTGAHQLRVRVEPRDWRFQSLVDTVRVGLRHLLVLRPQPTALVLPTDSIAVVVIRALKEHRLKVPDDMSIVSYGDTQMAKAHHPPMTSMRPPLEQMGHTVAELIERRLAQSHAVPVSVQLEGNLCEEETVDAWPRS